MEEGLRGSAKGKGRIREGRGENGKGERSCPGLLKARGGGVYICDPVVIGGGRDASPQKARKPNKGGETPVREQCCGGRNGHVCIGQ